MPKRPDRTRKPNRPINAVRQDIEATSKILREDIYDVLKASQNKTRDQAEKDLDIFLRSLNSKAIEYQGDKEKGISRVLSDMDSYRIEWKK